MFNWNRSNSSQSESGVTLTPTPSPVSEALILICEKCGKKMSSDSDKNVARDLGFELKTKIKAAGGKGKVRAVVTGCLDVCPSGSLVVAISRAGARDDEFYTLTGNLENAADVILEHVNSPKR